MIHRQHFAWDINRALKRPVSELIFCSRCKANYGSVPDGDDFIVNEEYVCKACLTPAEIAEFNLGHLETPGEWL